VKSGTGSANGVTLQNETCNTKLTHLLVREVSGGLEGSWTPAWPAYPNVPPTATGLVVDSECYNIHHTSVVVEEVEGKASSSKVVLKTL